MVSTLMSSMFSTPGPTTSTTFRNSSSVQLFGILPINNLCLVSESEHLKVLPCKIKNTYILKIDYQAYQKTRKKRIIVAINETPSYSKHVQEFQRN